MTENIELAETIMKRKMDSFRRDFESATFGEAYFEQLENEEDVSWEATDSPNGKQIVCYTPSRFTFVFSMVKAKMYIFDNNVLLQDFYFDPRCEIETFLISCKQLFVQELKKMCATATRCVRPDESTVLCGPFYRITRFERTPENKRICFQGGEPKCVIYIGVEGKIKVHTSEPLEEFIRK